MSAKFLYTVTDENPDLHKHIGCMNGIFQLFDRQHFLPGRRLNAQKHKRVTSGQSGNRGVETSSTLRKATENNLKEKHRISTESSRTSFSSSSCSSSFSSFDCHKIPQLEPSGQLIFPETPSPHFPKNQVNSSIKLSQSVDLHDVVKDCIYRGINSSPIKTMKKDGRAQTLIHVDSPRPVQVPKSSKVKTPGPSETFQGAKLREGRFNQVADCSRVVASKDSRRSSCDGREITLESTAKVKELPRLSLDSKQSTMRSSIRDMKSNYILGDLQRKNENFNKIKSSHQEPESYKGPSSVVAKLMGLEISRDSISTKEDHRRLDLAEEQFNISSKSSKIFEENKQNYMPRSPRTSQTEPVSPWFRNTDPVMKSPSIKLSAAAPMQRLQDDGQGSQIDFNCRESTAKGLNSPSVYGEIQKRWAELEFKKSGKDLRALKQILEAMQKTKELLETRKDQDSYFISQISNNRSIHDRSSKLANTKNLQSSIPIVAKETSSPTNFKSPIVIMKLATVVEKASNPASLVFPTDSASSGFRRLKTSTSRDCKRESIQMAKDITPRVRDPSSGPLQTTNKNSCTRASRSRQISKVPQQIVRKNAVSTDTNSETMSPRLQLKIDYEKKSRSTTPTSDLSTTRRQLSKLPTDSDSPGRKTGPKSPNSRHNNQLYKVNKGAKDWRENGDANPLLPERHISFATHPDREITRTKTSNETDDTSFHKELQKEKSPAEKLNDNIQTTESAIVKLEQPSPVSVLDAAVYRDESPSPVKKISNRKDDWATIFEGVECNLEDLNYYYSHIANSEIHPENTECLAHTLGKDRPDIDYISPSTDDVDSDHGYIFEILLASGLLRALDSGAKTIQIHKSGLPINPFIFFELEEIKVRTKLANDENSKIQRKLIFDAVNEILIPKLVLECSSNKWFPSNKKTGRELRSQQLWREICVEINQLQADSYCSLDDEDDRMQSLLWKELTLQSMNWRDYQREISGLVLNIERLIFRDLISEIVSSEVASQQHQHNISGHCRKLFPM